MRRKERASLPSSSSQQLDLSNKQIAKTNTTSICRHPVGSAKARLVLTLLKVCHIFLIIFYWNSCKDGSHGSANVNLWRGNVSDVFSWGSQG